VAVGGPSLSPHSAAASGFPEPSHPPKLPDSRYRFHSTGDRPPEEARFFGRFCAPEA